MTSRNLYSYSLISENVKIQTRIPYVITLFCEDIIRCVAQQDAHENVWVKEGKVEGDQFLLCLIKHHDTKQGVLELRCNSISLFTLALLRYKFLL
jgi:uncharacterized protein involved in tolerance to divalent cations